eukprot:Skav218169  [mRNA]  locus=scaffold5213:138158:141079:- [translate_table: standard]
MVNCIQLFNSLGSKSALSSGRRSAEAAPQHLSKRDRGRHAAVSTSFQIQRWHFLWLRIIEALLCANMYRPGMTWQLSMATRHISQLHTAKQSEALKGRLNIS